jgi:hypothetical protein
VNDTNTFVAHLIIGLVAAAIAIWLHAQFDSPLGKALGDLGL